VAIESPTAVRLGTDGVDGVAGPTVRLDPTTVKTTAPRVETIATTLEATLGEAHVVARTVRSTVDVAKQVFGFVESRADRIVERARNVYRDVEELAQTRAGRIRLVAEQTLHVLGERTLLKSRRETKVKAEKIYLG
jgi:hypothetical protein